MNVLVFGDSLSWGAWDRRGGWVQRLRAFLDERSINEKIYDPLLYNESISGNTTMHLLERFEFETKQIVREGSVEMLIFAIGANDAGFFKSKNANWTDKKQFETNIRKLIELGRRFTDKIIFIGIFPADEKNSLPVSWAPDLYYYNKYFREYNDIIKSVCKNDNIIFIDIFQIFSKLDYSKMIEDGVHLNSLGHEKMFETVKGVLIKNKMI
jgi:lysophospholipase L1-like esterase